MGAEIVATRLSAVPVLVRSRHPEMAWLDRGACRGLDPDIFYPDDDLDEAADAKAVCSQCVARTMCLEHALSNREKVGVWGGFTERERRRLVRQRRRSA